MHSDSTQRTISDLQWFLRSESQRVMSHDEHKVMPLVHWTFGLKIKLANFKINIPGSPFC